jgi:outer membrane protein assembly factor BamB
VTAHSTTGAALWQRDLTPASDRSSDASGGGLAAGAGQLFVSSGFGTLTALNPEDGAVLWSQDLDASGAGAPTVYGNLVYLVSRDNTAWALDVKTGRIEWTVSGTPSTANLVGGAAPAVNDRLAFFPFSTDEVTGVFRKGGVQLWNAPVSGQRAGRVYARISDISGDPVIAGNRVYVGNQSGRVVALDAANGERIWTARDGALGPVWPVGGSLFIVNDLGQLVRLNARNGARIWAVDLPLRKERRFGRARSVYAHYGPILAGGRIFVGSSDGVLRAFDPRSGALVEQIEVPGGVATSPIVAGGTLYVVSGRGKLHAFR